MIDVEYHFANLWFAAKSSNWPLATFYLNETRGHLNWSLRVRSVRKLADGSELDLRPILKGIEETGGLAHLKAASTSKTVQLSRPRIAKRSRSATRAIRRSRNRSSSRRSRPRPRRR